MPETVEELAHVFASDTLKRQVESLERLRTRSLTLLTIAVSGTSFLACSR